MSDFISLEQIDKDGAVREAAEAVGADRRTFLRRGAMTGAGFVAGGVMFNGMLSPAQAAISTSKPSKANDVKILNYALTLEYLEAEFYAQATANKLGNQDQQMFARIVGEHEAEHVKFLEAALGDAAVAKPTFDFGKTVTDLSTFLATAVVLEDTGVSAYAGQGPNLSQKPVVKAALSIHSVEARHAAWARFLAYGGSSTDIKQYPAPVPFDLAHSDKFVLSAVAATGFIKA